MMRLNAELIRGNINTVFFLLFSLLQFANKQMKNSFVGNLFLGLTIYEARATTHLS